MRKVKTSPKGTSRRSTAPATSLASVSSDQRRSSSLGLLLSKPQLADRAGQLISHGMRTATGRRIQPIWADRAASTEPNRSGGLKDGGTYTWQRYWVSTS